MIRKFIARLFKRGPEPGPRGPVERIYKVAEHGIRRDSLSRCALRVTDQLREAGYKAYVVGGAVRDLLVGIEPKDFDVATDATPDQIRKVIRRSRVIGRRFQIVHALCGDEVVEVSTFRAHQVDAGEDDRHVDQHGRLLRDNVFGTMPEDALRRDFTANALFYDPATEEVVDYCNGVADIRNRRLRMIGDPAVRYREDPVRMLRGVRFAAKLRFELDDATRAPIAALSDLLANVPPSRLFDEMLKLLLSGHSLECVTQLRREGLHHGLLPLLDVILEQPQGQRFVELALSTTDDRIARDKPVSPAFLFAALLWHEVLSAWRRHEGDGMREIPALFAAMDDVLDAQKEKLQIPRRYDAVMKELWSLQPRFVQRSGSRPLRLLEHPRFRAAYDFLRLRCDAGELDAELGDWWERFQSVDAAERDAMLIPEKAPRKRRRRGRGRGAGSGGEGGGGSDAPEPAPESA
jgi:poly(A) polymerase